MPTSLPPWAPEVATVGELIPSRPSRDSIPASIREQAIQCPHPTGCEPRILKGLAGSIRTRASHSATVRRILRRTEDNPAWYATRSYCVGLRTAILPWGGRLLNYAAAMHAEPKPGSLVRFPSPADPPLRLRGALLRARAVLYPDDRSSTGSKIPAFVVTHEENSPGALNG